MAPNRYFHIRGGREGGPFTAVELQGLARRGAISPDDLIRPEGAQRSYPARNVVGLFSNSPAANPPAAPPAKSPSPSPQRQAIISHAPQMAAARQASRGAPNTRSALTALLASLIELQREELTRQVVRGERTAADAERRAGELLALLRAVEQQLAPHMQSPGAPMGAPVVAPRIAHDGAERVQHTAAAPSPLFAAPSPPPPPAESGLGTALGIGAAALIAGGAGMALGRAMAPNPPPPERPAPPREPEPPVPGLAQVSRALWSMRPRDGGNHLAADPPTHDPSHVDSGAQELSHHDLPHDTDIPTADPIQDADIVDGNPIEYDAPPTSGLTWDDPVPDAGSFASSPPDDIPMAEPLEQDGGGFFGNLFGGGGDAPETTEVEASGGDGGWFGFGGDDATVETDGGWLGGGGDDAVVEGAGGLFGGDGLDAGVDAGDIDLGGLDLTDGGGFEF